MSQWSHPGPAAIHAGRGPRRYRRDDNRIYEDVCDRLTDACEVDASAIEVAVQAGEVTLRGTVTDRGMRRRAEEIAERVGGVVHVRNEIRVQAQGLSNLSGGYGTPVAAAYGLDAIRPERRAEEQEQERRRPDQGLAAEAGEPQRTVAGLIDTVDEAERAARQLETAGYGRALMAITRDEAVVGQAELPPPEPGFLASLKALLLPEADRDSYAEGIRRGGALLTVTVGESRADEVLALLRQAGAADRDASRYT